MERATVELYEREAARYERRRRAGVDPSSAERLGRRVRRGGVRGDLGCGPGLFTDALGGPVVGLDAAHAMVRRARHNVPYLLGVQADLEALPFRRGALAGAWARKSYLHVPRHRVPAALAQLHGALEVGAPVSLTLGLGEVGDGLVFPGDDFPGRFFAGWRPDEVGKLLAGAGFVDVEMEEGRTAFEARAVRALGLADTVASGMRVVVCGLNPSIHAADAGVGYAGPGNRFWPAALEAGLVARPFDPFDALQHGVGMTDLVKRATPRASDVSRAEFRAGAARVQWLVQWLGPRAVCFVGLAGYRTAVDSGAEPGWQAERFAGVATYVMPSTSGINARTGYDEIVTHLREVALRTRV